MQAEDGQGRYRAYVKHGIRLEFITAPAGRHSHMDLELLYVLKGSLRLFVSDRELTLEAEDVAVINSGEEHGWEISPELLACVVIIRNTLPAREAGSGSVAFCCNSVTRQDMDYSELRSILGELIEEYSFNPALTFKKRSRRTDFPVFLKKQDLIPCPAPRAHKHWCR